MRLSVGLFVCLRVRVFVGFFQLLFSVIHERMLDNVLPHQAHWPPRCGASWGSRWWPQDERREHRTFFKSLLWHWLKKEKYAL